MATYELHDYILSSLLILNIVVQAVPGCYAFRICRMTGWVKYWSTSWILFTSVMFWILIRRISVLYWFDPGCKVTPIWIYDQLLNPIVTSIGLTAIAILKYKFYRYWLEASVIRIDEKKKVVANERTRKEKGHIKDEQQAVENGEKRFRDEGPKGR